MDSAPVTMSDQKLVGMFKALGHPARLRIVQILSERQACVCSEVVEELPLAQATVSQHLKVLKQAGIITGEIQGPAVCYCLTPGALEVLKSGVMGLVANATTNFDAQPQVFQVRRRENTNEDPHTA